MLPLASTSHTSSGCQGPLHCPSSPPILVKNSNLRCRGKSTVLKKLSPRSSLVKTQSCLQNRPMSSESTWVQTVQLQVLGSTVISFQRGENTLPWINTRRSSQGRAPTCQLQLQPWLHLSPFSLKEVTILEKLLLPAALTPRKDLSVETQHDRLRNKWDGLLVSLPVLCHWFLHEVLKRWLFAAFLCNCRRKGCSF